MAPEQRSPWVFGLAIGLGIGVGLIVGSEVNSDSFWVRMLVSVAAAGATALGIAGLAELSRRLLRKGDA